MDKASTEVTLLAFQKFSFFDPLTTIFLQTNEHLKKISTVKTDMIDSLP